MAQVPSALRDSARPGSTVSGNYLVEIQEFLQSVTNWAQQCEAVVGLALVGSHARGEACPDSDIDLFVLCADARELIGNSGWTGEFGVVEEVVSESYGPTTSIRVFYNGGTEVEFGIADPAWANVPLDAGTQRVISDGIRILHDPIGLYEKARKAAT